MSNLFEVIDPRGRTVICTKECWEDHILSARPFMSGWIDELKNAIEKPRIGIYQDATYEIRHVYYGSHHGQTRYIKVVVEFQEEAIGYVITAYPTNTPRPGELLIWLKKSEE